MNNHSSSDKCADIDLDDNVKERAATASVTFSGPVSLDKDYLSPSFALLTSSIFS